MQERHYYPFGMEMSELSYNYGSNIANKYLYNGKEMQNDYNLYWYDYGKRFYDPALARFHSVDPLATDYYFQSPYAYAVNNPLRFTDFMGMGPEEEVKKIEPLKFDLKEIFTNALASVGLNPKAPTETTPEELQKTNEHNEEQTGIRENITETVKEGVGNTADAAEIIGTELQLAGYATLDLPVIGAGKIVEGAGAITNAAIDASEGNLGKATVYATTSLVYGGVGRKITNMKNAGKFTSQDSGILNFLTDVHSNITSTIANLFIDKQKEKKK